MLCERTGLPKSLLESVMWYAGPAFFYQPGRVLARAGGRSFCNQRPCVSVPVFESTQAGPPRGSYRAGVSQQPYIAHSTLGVTGLLSCAFAVSCAGPKELFQASACF